MFLFLTSCAVKWFYLLAVDREISELVDGHFPLTVPHQDTACPFGKQEGCQRHSGSSVVHNDRGQAAAQCWRESVRAFPQRRLSVSDSLTCWSSAPRPPPAVCIWLQTRWSAPGTSGRRTPGCARTWSSAGGWGGCASTAGWCSLRSSSGTDPGWMETTGCRLQRATRRQMIDKCAHYWFLYLSCKWELSVRTTQKINL